jgi:hypothetical protein
MDTVLGVRHNRRGSEPLVVVEVLRDGHHQFIFPTSQLETTISFLTIVADSSESLANRCTAVNDTIDLLVHLISKSDGGGGSWTCSADLVAALQKAVTTAIDERTALSCQ